MPISTFFLAQVVDNLSMLCWLNSEDGAKGRNRPPMISEKLKREVESKTGQFADADSFEAARMRMLMNNDSPKEGD